MKDLRTIILAAGKGTRMKSDVPKVLHPVCGKPIIRYVLEAIESAGSLKTYVVVGHQSEAVKNFLGSNAIAVEQKELLGTADAVRRVGPHLKMYEGDVLIVCGDTPLLTKATLSKIVRTHRKTGSVCTFLTAMVEDPRGYGRVIRDTEGGAVAIREDKDADARERAISEINVGVYCCRSRELFGALKKIQINARKKEFYLTDAIAIFCQEGCRVSTVATQDPQEGLGINTREDLAAAGAALRNRILKKHMEEGVTIIDPGTTYIDATSAIGRDTVIHPFTVIEGGVRVGRHCQIGPFARLRPGTVIHDKVEIGNFTEVSRTQIGSGTFMKHFSFLGDSSVGANANIGAGVVTANFDGKNKYKCKIEEGAFIGSDSILIAPVSIGKKAVVGAGSVVTKGKIIPDGSVAVGMPAKIISRKEWHE